MWVTDSCRNGWNVWNWSIFCKVWIWILQNLCSLSCKSINFVLVVKLTLMLLFWLFASCLWYVWFIKLGCIRCHCVMKENILNFTFLILLWHGCSPWKRYCENLQQSYRRTPMSKCDFNKFAVQLYWNHTSTWVFSCKSAAYFHNKFS